MPDSSPLAACLGALRLGSCQQASGGAATGCPGQIISRALCSYGVDRAVRLFMELSGFITPFLRDGADECPQKKPLHLFGELNKGLGRPFQGIGDVDIKIGGLCYTDACYHPVLVDRLVLVGQVL